jgi:hypothetical protein
MVWISSTKLKIDLPRPLSIIPDPWIDVKMKISGTSMWEQILDRTGISKIFIPHERVELQF